MERDCDPDEPAESGIEARRAASVAPAARVPPQIETPIAAPSSPVPKSAETPAIVAG